MGKRICAERAATAPLRVGQHFAQLKPFPILALGALACQVVPATVTAGHTYHHVRTTYVVVVVNVTCVVVFCRGKKQMSS